jgi:hypothetical protein
MEAGVNPSKALPISSIDRSRISDLGFRRLFAIANDFMRSAELSDQEGYRHAMEFFVCFHIRVAHKVH